MMGDILKGVVGRWGVVGFRMDLMALASFLGKVWHLALC